MEQYFREIGKYPLLTPEEEYILAKKCKDTQCEKSREKLVASNLRYVISIAKRYVGQGIDFEDLVAEGNVGLVKALKCYEPDRGFKFITYASWWIKQSILKAISDTNRTIRIPANKSFALAKIRAVENELTQELSGPPTTKQIQDKLNELMAHNINVEKTLKVTNSCVDLNSCDSYDNELINNVADTTQTPPDKAMRKTLLLKELKKALEGFTQREKDIIYLYHGLGDLTKPLTLEEIGNLLNLTRERVRQIKAQTLKKLKSRGKLDKFRETLCE
jgi:RNA polymerase primary sigma factor